MIRGGVSNVEETIRLASQYRHTRKRYLHLHQVYAEVREPLQVQSGETREPLVPLVEDLARRTWPNHLRTGHQRVGLKKLRQAMPIFQPHRMYLEEYQGLFSRLYLSLSTISI